MQKPSRTDVTPDSFALVVQNDHQELWQYEAPVPWEEPDWVEKKTYNHDDAPSLNYSHAEIEIEEHKNESKTVIYASTIESASPDQSNQQTPTVKHGYAVMLSNGKVVPDVLSGEAPSPTQEENMAEFTETLIEEEDLLDEITIPYFPSSSRKNCLMNDTEFHPDGREMANSSELSNGYFVFTGLNKQAKKRYMEELAGKVGLKIEFLGEW